jgi:hypothetical protein
LYPIRVRSLSPRRSWSDQLHSQRSVRTDQKEGARTPVRASGGIVLPSRGRSRGWGWHRSRPARARTVDQRGTHPSEGGRQADLLYRKPRFTGLRGGQGPRHQDDRAARSNTTGPGRFCGAKADPVGFHLWLRRDRNGSAGERCGSDGRRRSDALRSSSRAQTGTGPVGTRDKSDHLSGRRTEAKAGRRKSLLEVGPLSAKDHARGK